MPLADLVRGIPGVTLHGDGARPVSGIRLDSRRVTGGDLFAALSGQRVDGRSWIRDAVARGAVAVLSTPPEPPSAAAGDVAWVESNAPRRSLALMCRRYFAAPDERLDVVGVTGTDGKTTTVALIAAALEAAGRSTATVGTLGRRRGGVSEDSPLTTPEATELWPFLAECADAGVTAVAMEASSAAIVADRVWGLKFAVGVLTGVGRDHLDLHGDAESYRAAKRALFESLPDDAVAVLPSGYEYGDFRDATRARVVTFGDTPDADWRVVDHEPSVRGARYSLRGPGFVREVVSTRPGPWDAQNLAAALAVAGELGAEPGLALRGAASLERVSGRWETIDEGQPFLAVVDYAHTPEALARVAELLRRIASGRVIVVFGCGGERDRGKREEMGRAAARVADFVVVTDDNPRSEDPEEIADAVLRGTRHGSARVERIAARDRAIARGVELARADDALLVAGKGHETYQEVRGRRLDFDDRSALRAAIRSARAGR